VAQEPEKVEVSIIVPCYNEQAAIGDYLGEIVRMMDSTAMSSEIIVVDDGSTDNTAGVVEAVDGVRLVRHIRNKGVGAARKTGIRRATGDIIVMTDGDGTYPVEPLPEMIERLKEYDMVVGARRVERGTWAPLRRAAKFIIRKLAEYITGQKIPDLNSGLRAFKRDKAIEFFNVLPDGHSWVSTITLCFMNANYDVLYVPIDYYERKGKSTFHPVHDTAGYLMTVFTTVMYFKPGKILAPIAVVLLAWGAGYSLWTKFIIPARIKESTVMIFLAGVIVAVLALMADMMVKLHRKG